jgi:hypothetical protein
MKMFSKLEGHKSILRYVLVVTLGYFALAGAGITSSHSSALYGDNDEKSNVLFGSARQQRSDEFLRGTPRAIAALRDIKMADYTPLDYSGTLEYRNQQSSTLSLLNYYSSPIHTIFVDKFSKFMPIEIAYAAGWWLNIWVLFVSVPLFFYLLGLRISLGALCALAIFASPTSSWFSYLPSALLGQAFASASLALMALNLLEKPTLAKNAFALVCGFYAGRMAFSVAQYPPWGIPILVLIGVIVISHLSVQGISRQLLLNIVQILSVGTIAALIVLFYNRQIFTIALETVYPGSRREAGGNGDQILWSGGISWFFQSTFARSANLTNPEVILGPTFMVIPFLFLYIKNRASDLYSRSMLRASSGSLALLLVLICWSQFHWPAWALNFNPLVWTPSARADQIVGVLVLVPVFMIVNFQAKDRIPYGSAFLITLLTVGIAARDMQSTLGTFLPGASQAILMVSILFVSIVTISFVRLGSPFLRITPLLIVLVASSILVNPFVRGVGALGKSNAVTVLKDLSKTSPNGRWATTGFYLDALMISTGVPQLSGQQPYGPNAEAWRKIDTQSKFEDNWNRGQSYIQFAWDPRKDMVIWNPSGDVIQVVVNPCDTRLQDLQLHWVMSPTPLSYECLKERSQVKWMGVPVHIYEILNSPMFDNRSFDFSR